MWGYYAELHLFVSSREPKKGSNRRVPDVSTGCHPYALTVPIKHRNPSIFLN
jgi:hypothetical protein